MVCESWAWNMVHFTFYVLNPENHQQKQGIDIKALFFMVAYCISKYSRVEV